MGPKAHITNSVMGHLLLLAEGFLSRRLFASMLRMIAAPHSIGPRSTPPHATRKEPWRYELDASRGGAYALRRKTSTNRKFRLSERVIARLRD